MPSQYRIWRKGDGVTDFLKTLTIWIVSWWRPLVESSLPHPTGPRPRNLGRVPNGPHHMNSEWLRPLAAVWTSLPINIGHFTLAAVWWGIELSTRGRGTSFDGGGLVRVSLPNSRQRPERDSAEVTRSRRGIELSTRGRGTSLPINIGHFTLAAVLFRWRPFSSLPLDYLASSRGSVKMCTLPITTPSYGGYKSSTPPQEHRN